MTKKQILLVILAAAVTPCLTDGQSSPALAQAMFRPPTGPRTFLGQTHPGKIKSLSGDGLIVELRDSGPQAVQYDEIWRIRQSFVSDEPPGTSVIDFASTRLFVATPLDSLLEELGKKVPLTRLTAPNGQEIYIVATKVTDVSNALPGLHNPASKAVISTREGTQQVEEAAGEVKKMIASAHVAQ